MSPSMSDRPVSGYDPFVDPLDLPIQRLVLSCRSARPLCFPPREGATVGTTLTGAWQRALRRTACEVGRSGVEPCAREGDDAALCAAPRTCPVGRLVKPRSAVHRRDFSGAVLLRARSLESGLPSTSFDLEVTLLGRKAIQEREDVLQGLEGMGATGLDVAGRRIPFHCDLLSASPALRLHQWSPAPDASSAPRALLVFESPTLHVERQGAEGTGRRGRAMTAGGQLPLEGLLGQAAYELVAWDIEDRGGLTADGRHERDCLASTARAEIARRAQAVDMLDCVLEPIALGMRRSRRSGDMYPLLGFVGTAELSGPLAPVLPWLTWMSLSRAGQNRAQGFGENRLWLGGTWLGPPWGRPNDGYGSTVGDGGAS